MLICQLVQGQNKFIPSAIRIGTDLSDIGISIFDDKKTIYEFHADVDIHKYFLVIDYGHFDITRSEQTFVYQNKGSFFRIGPDANFLHKSKLGSVLFFGFRIARSNFEDQVTFIKSDINYGTFPVSRSNRNISANWWEFTTGIKVKIWKNLYLGYTGRFKFRKKLDASENLIPFDIPGFGKADERSVFGINYHIFYRIPLKEKVQPGDNETN